LSTQDPIVLYEAQVTGIPLLIGNSDASEIASPRFAVKLPAGQATQLRVYGDLTSVQGAEVIVEKFDQEWAILRRPDDGLAIVELESTVSPDNPGDLTRTDLPPPIKIGLNEKSQLKISEATIAQFVVDGPHRLLAAEASCETPTDLTFIDGRAGRSVEPQRGPTGTLLPLRLSSGTYELLLSSQTYPKTCWVSVREVNEQPLTEIKPQAITLNPGQLSTAFALQFPRDVVLSTAQPAGVTASINCPTTGTSRAVPNTNRLVAFLPANKACTLWLVRSDNADGGQSSTQLLVPQPID
jgi:hypothetical protein